MSKAKTSRKQFFRAALAIAGLTAEQWAAREGVTAGHLSMILSGTRHNERIEARIDAFTKQQLKKPIALAS